MSPRSAGRTAPCDGRAAAVRLLHAEKFLEVARLVGDEPDPDGEYANVAASLAVLAGIAASDAMTCTVLGLRSRAQDHREAISLLAQVEPGGTEAANHLRRLLDLKDTANYGVMHVSTGQVRSAVRQARTLVGHAGRVRRGLR